MIPWEIGLVDGVGELLGFEAESSVLLVNCPLLPSQAGDKTIVPFKDQIILNPCLSTVGTKMSVINNYIDIFETLTFQGKKIEIINKQKISKYFHP